LHVLKGTHQPGAGDGVGRAPGDVGPPKKHRAAVHQLKTADAIDRGRLAGSVGSDQTGNAATLYGKRQAVDGANAGE